jgi:methyl acetate hydrolase
MQTRFGILRKRKGSPIAKAGPLMFEPGARWQYGQGVDWAGRVVEQLAASTSKVTFRPKFWGR